MQVIGEDITKRTTLEEQGKTHLPFSMKLFNLLTITLTYRISLYERERVKRFGPFALIGH